MPSSVSICFPAYNEAASLIDALTEAEALIKGTGWDYEVLVCDDGSSDGTADLAEQFAADRPRFRVIHHSVNRGIRATYEHLYAEAGKDYVFLNSTDRQFPTQSLLDMLPLAGSFDLIIGTRRDKHYGIFRKVVSGTLNAIPHVLFGVRTYDAGSIKLVRREVFTATSPLVSLSPFSEAERIIRAHRLGYRIATVPVEFHPRTTGRSTAVRPVVLLQALLDVPRVWWALRLPGGGRSNAPKEPVE